MWCHCGFIGLNLRKYVNSISFAVFSTGTRSSVTVDSSSYAFCLLYLPNWKREKRWQRTKLCGSSQRFQMENAWKFTSWYWRLRFSNVCLRIMGPHSRAPKKNTSHGNEVLSQDTTPLIQRPCYQLRSPCQDPAGNRTTRRLDHRKETQTAVVWTCLPFIRSDQNHFARHSEGGK